MSQSNQDNAGAGPSGVAPSAELAAVQVLFRATAPLQAPPAETEVDPRYSRLTPAERAAREARKIRNSQARRGRPRLFTRTIPFVDNPNYITAAAAIGAVVFNDGSGVRVQDVFGYLHEIMLDRLAFRFLLKRVARLDSDSRTVFIQEIIPDLRELACDMNAKEVLKKLVGHRSTTDEQRLMLVQNLESFFYGFVVHPAAKFFMVSVMRTVPLGRLFEFAKLFYCVNTKTLYKDQGSGMILFHIIRRLTLVQTRPIVNQLIQDARDRATEVNGVLALNLILSNPEAQFETVFVAGKLIGHPGDRFLSEISCHRQGYKVVKTMLEVLPNEIRSVVACRVAPHFAEIAVNEFGRFVAEKMCEALGQDRLHQVARSLLGSGGASDWYSSLRQLANERLAHVAVEALFRNAAVQTRTDILWEMRRNQRVFFHNRMGRSLWTRLTSLPVEYYASYEDLVANNPAARVYPARASFVPFVQPEAIPLPQLPIVPQQQLVELQVFPLEEYGPQPVFVPEEGDDVDNELPQDADDAPVEPGAEAVQADPVTFVVDPNPYAPNLYPGVRVLSRNGVAFVDDPIVDEFNQLHVRPDSSSLEIPQLQGHIVALALSEVGSRLIADRLGMVSTCRHGVHHTDCDIVFNEIMPYFDVVLRSPTGSIVLEQLMVFGTDEVRQNLFDIYAVHWKHYVVHPEANRFAAAAYRQSNGPGREMIARNLSDMLFHQRVNAALISFVIIDMIYTAGAGVALFFGEYAAQYMHLVLRSEEAISALAVFLAEHPNGPNVRRVKWRIISRVLEPRNLFRIASSHAGPEVVAPILEFGIETPNNYWMIRNMFQKLLPRFDAMSVTDNGSAIWVSIINRLSLEHLASLIGFIEVSEVRQPMIAVPPHPVAFGPEVPDGENHRIERGDGQHDPLIRLFVIDHRMPRVGLAAFGRKVMEQLYLSLLMRDTGGPVFHRFRVLFARFQDCFMFSLHGHRLYRWIVEDQMDEPPA